MSLVPSADQAALPGSWVIGVGLFTTGAVAVLMYRAGLTVDFWSSSLALMAVGGLLALRIVLGTSKTLRVRHRTARDTAEYIAWLGATALFGGIASYADAAGSSGFVDADLQWLDRILGFDWLAWYRVVAGHPVLQAGGRIAYATIFATPLVLLGYFAAAGRKAEARAFLASFWLTAAVTLLLFHFMPAAGPLASLWHGPIPYMPTTALYQAQLIPLLQHHSLHRIDLVELRGLVCVPSFHAACAILYTLAVWPIERLRWPVTLVNCAMLLATPVEGTHYMVDMIVGALVALLAFKLIALVTRRAHVSLAAA